MNFVHKLQQDEEPALDAIGKLAQKDSTEATVSGRRPGAGLAQSFAARFAARNESALFGHTKYRGKKAAKRYPNPTLVLHNLESSRSPLARA